MDKQEFIDNLERRLHTLPKNKILDVGGLDFKFAKILKNAYDTTYIIYGPIIDKNDSQKYAMSFLGGIKNA